VVTDGCGDRLIGNLVRGKVDGGAPILLQKALHSDCSHRVPLRQVNAEFARYALLMWRDADKLLASINFAAVDRS
jgi:hypothetical protein